MFSDVLVALRRTTLVDQVLVVSKDHGAQRIAGGYGAMVLDDDDSGHNSAARRGIGRALELERRSGAADPRRLPAAGPGRTRRAGRPPGHRAVVLIVPDCHGTGTNALLLIAARCAAALVRPRQPRPSSPGRDASPASSPRPSSVPLAGARHRYPEDLAASRPDLGETRGGAAHTRGMLRQLLRSRSAEQRASAGGGRRITAVALDGLPEVRAGDDPAALIAAAMPAGAPAPGDVLVVAHKLISKAEGRTRRLSEVTPGERARSLAGELGKDPRHVQVILDETREVRRAQRGVLISVTHHGFVCANAGVDASNAARRRHRHPAAPRPRRLGPAAAGGAAPRAGRAARRW